MKIEIKDLFVPQNKNNYQNFDRTFFLASIENAHNNNLKAKTEIPEWLCTAYDDSKYQVWNITKAGDSYFDNNVYFPLAVRPLVRINLPSLIKSNGQAKIGEHSVKFSKENDKYYVTIKDLAMPKNFSGEVMDLKKLYSQPASKFKPAKFEILNWTSNKDEYLLAVLDQPLTCIPFGKNNKYNGSFVNDQLKALPDLMFEKSLECAGTKKVKAEIAL